VYYYTHIEIAPKGSQAARLRQRKFELLRRFPIPADLLPGSLALTHRRCGQPTCHCARDKKGHPIWSLTFMDRGKKRVERISKAWVEEVQRRVDAGREFERTLAKIRRAFQATMTSALMNRVSSRALSSLWHGQLGILHGD